MIQCKALNIDYHKERPKLSEKAQELFKIFNLLNRRRIDHRPLQKSDILDEVLHMNYIDKALDSIEIIDSHWLKKEADRLSKK